MSFKKIIVLFIFASIISLCYTINSDYYASQENGNSEISAKRLILTKILHDEGVSYDKANKLIHSLSNEEISKLYIEKDNLKIGEYYSNADVYLMFAVVIIVLWALGVR